MAPARMRIAMFTNTLVPLAPDGGILAGQDFGGVDYGSWALGRALARLGHDVDVVTTARSGALDVEADLGPAAGHWRVHHLRPSVHVAQTPIAVPMLWRPHRLLPDVDVALARMGNQPAPLAAVRFARRRGIPLAVSYHGDWTGGYGSLARRAAVAAQQGWLAGHVLRRADAVVALSEPLARASPHLRKVAGKTTVIPNGVDPGLLEVHEERPAIRQRLGIPAEAPVVATMGTLNPIKGLDVLLDAWPQVVRACPGAVLLVLGEGPRRAEYESRAARLGIAGTVRFLGFVHAGKADLLAAADVFCLPSRSEAFPNAVAEAAWLARPIVASRLPVLAALIEDGRSGVLVTPEDPSALAQALADLLRDADRQRRLGAAARAWATGLSWDAVAARTAALLADLVRAKAA